MIKRKNFSGQYTPKMIDLEYGECNFSHAEPVFKDGKWLGHKLFPGDDTPRTFRHCNLVNCEPPPNSTVIDCNCAIVRPHVMEEIGESQIHKRIAYGKWTLKGYLYFDTPKEKELTAKEIARYE
jgi:hypothetical protein